MKDALLALYALQEVDTALSVAKQKLNALDRGDAERAAAESARTLYDQVNRTLHDLSADLTDAELELQSVEQKKKQYEDKLYGGRVTNPKELASMQEEIEALGRQRGRLDERILVLMDQVETLKAQVREAHEKLASAEGRLHAKEAVYREAYREISERIAELEDRRVKAAEAVPVTLLKRYEAVRAQRGGVGAARVEGGLCSVCHTSLPTNLVRRVQSGDTVELCENCGRILCTVAS
ncbi:MAG: zinc ribbon domain-containing protein [Chthonomonadales bacterium]